MPTVFLLALLISSLAGQAAPPAPSAVELARDLQRRYDQVRDFSADFEHEYEGGVLRKTLTEYGTLLVKKPGMMRWTYTSPEKKEFVSDGHKLYSYVPEDRQVMISNVSADDDTSSPAMFLAGKGDILRDYTPSLLPMPGLLPGEVALKLVPKTRQRDYDWLVVVLDRATLQIHRLVTTDSQGGTSTFVFTNMKENIRVPDKAFTFKVPRGVDVITDSVKR